MAPPRRRPNRLPATVRRRLLAIDVGLGLLLAIVVLIFAPGLAVVAIAAVIVLLAIATGFLRNVRRARTAGGRRPGRPLR